MGKYRVLGSLLDRVFRNNLNANFDDVDADIQTQKKRVDDLITGVPQPSEVVDARGGAPVLRDRLDGVDAQLADLPKQLEKGGLSGLKQKYELTRSLKVTTIGDSTADNETAAQYIWSEMSTFYGNSGDILEGLTFTHRGANGNTLANFINNTSPAGKNIDDAIADQADLYIFTYGINDVRLGATSEQQLKDRLNTAISRLLKETNGYVLLRVPNSFTSDDPGATGWVSPLSSAQAYTDILWNAYMSIKEARVEIMDMQTLMFGRTCQPLASSPLMNDILHPNVDGYKKMGKLIANYIGVPTLIRDDLIKKAQTDNPSKPYLVYPKYLEARPDIYELVAQGYFVGMGSNYLDFAFDPSLAANAIKGGYILKIGDKLTYDLPTNPLISASGSNTRIGNTTFTGYENNNKGIVKVFRLKALAPTKSVNFYGTNMSGLQFAQYHSLDVKTLLTSVAANLKNPIGSVVTFDLKVSSGGTVKTLGTITFQTNNMTGSFAWNTTDFPNSNATIFSTDFLLLVCGTTTHTGEMALRVGLS